MTDEAIGDDVPLYRRAMQLGLAVRETAILQGAARMALASILSGTRQGSVEDAEADLRCADQSHRKALWEWYAAAHDEIVRVSTVRQDDTDEQRVADHAGKGKGW